MINSKKISDISYNKSDDWYISLLKKPISIARYNDGEWYAMRNKCGYNCDRHRYFEKMNQLLRNAVSDSGNVSDDYIFQSSWCVNEIDVYNNLNMKVQFLKEDHVHAIFRNRPDKWKQVLDIIHEYPIILVGPLHLKNHPHISPNIHLVIPSENCFLKMDMILGYLKSLLKKETRRNNVIFCASMASNCFIDNLYKYAKGKHSLLDFGSVFDAMVDDTTIFQRTPVKNKIKEIREQYLNLKMKPRDTRYIYL